LTSSHAHIDFS